MKNSIFNLQLFADHANPFQPGITPGTPTTNPVQRTSDASFEPAFRPFLNTNLLENSHDEEIFSQFSVKGTIKGNEVVWNKWNKFRKCDGTPLKEGVIPAAENFGMTAIKANIEQFGMYTAISDRLQNESLYDVMYGASEEMGYSMSETKNALARNILDQSTYLILAEDKETRKHPNAMDEMGEKNVITARMVNKMRTFFVRNSVPKIDGYWVWIIHPDAAFDFTEDSGFKSPNEYLGANNPVFKGEIGMLHGFRFVETSACTVKKGAGSGASDVYTSYVLGKDSFGEVDAEGEGAEMILKSKEAAGGPLEQFATAGYKFTHGGAVLYPERCCKVMSTSTFLESDITAD